jgi:hypothetical protein
VGSRIHHNYIQSLPSSPFSPPFSFAIIASFSNFVAAPFNCAAFSLALSFLMYPFLTNLLPHQQLQL